MEESSTFSVVCTEDWALFSGLISLACSPPLYCAVYNDPVSRLDDGTVKNRPRVVGKCVPAPQWLTDFIQLSTLNPLEPTVFL